MRALLLATFLSAALFATPALAGVHGSACDGVLDPDEECDDGNTVSGDGCSFPSCLPEVCGDFISNPDPPVAETCDDGNTTSLDGCDAACHLECGNGTIEPLEDCDDSGQSALCDADCSIVECGDGDINGAAGEDCDDGNTIDDDECPNGCELIVVDPPGRGCVLSVNQRFASVLRAQARDVASCVAAVAAGRAAIGDCLGTDAHGRVAKAEAKTAAAFASNACTGANLPVFAFTTPATVNDAAVLEVLAAATAVLGDPPPLVTKAADAAGARCQTEAVRQLGAVASRFVIEANRAKKAAFRGGKGGSPAPAGSAALLGAAIDLALADAASLLRAERRAAAALARRCPLDPSIDALFDCGGATSSAGLAQCVVTTAKQAGCEALELADAIPLDCPTLAP